MKKLLLLGSALIISALGSAQSTARKAVNPKYLQKTSIVAKNKVMFEPMPTAEKSVTINKAKKGYQSTSSTCASPISLTTSWNCFGVGGGATTSSQNCLSYNQDLNTLVWTQRGSKTWSLTSSSGYMQATIINATTLVKDSIITYHDGTASHDARFPSGVLINPSTNTVAATMSYTNAIAVSIGQVTNGTIWTGTAYSAKPLWSTSALTHTNPITTDSLYTPTVTGIFGSCAAGNLTGAPATDLQYLYDGKTVVSVGTVDDATITAMDAIAGQGAIFAKGVYDPNVKAVNWSYTTIIPPVHKGGLGYSLSEGRMAFGPDGQHGYIVFTGILNTTYGNYSDSSMTPILYATTDGGATWTQKLAGYDWMTNHPEVEKNVGELVGMKRYYQFDEGLHSADVTVDANNVLHFVTCVSQNSFVTGDIDSLAVYGPVYQYDYRHYHPIIWDFMTDGNCWSTMMVDSILSAACGKSTGDTTSTHSAMGGSQILGVSSHITVSRSKDGSKVFYGWADSDTSVTGQVYNINPDVLMKAYDITSGKISVTKNVTNGIGTCFYPYLSDLSYNDGTNWVVPAVYTVGDVVTANSPQTTYDASSQAHYMYTNCGTFDPVTDFTISAPINPGTNLCTVSIKQNNTLESSVSNYPNPFNNNTTIAVILTESKNVDLKVYNAIGTLVFNKKFNGNVGENTINFDGSTLSSGVYYYSIKFDNQQVTKKMIIQK